MKFRCVTNVLLKLSTDQIKSSVLRHFKRVVNDKRINESEAEYESRHKQSRLKMKKARTLVQVGNDYTPKIFVEFQVEYQDACTCRKL